MCCRGRCGPTQTQTASKRQKDLADILRIIETFPDLTTKLPEGLKAQLQE
jgi:hypothetical protein